MTLQNIFNYKEPFDPSSETHKRNAIESLKCIYWSTRHFQLFKAGITITRRMKARIRKKAIGFAHNNFNKVKKEFISK